MKQINYTKYKPPRLRHHADSGLYIPLAQQKIKKEYYPPLLHEADWGDFFANPKPPAIIDVGCGMGKFTLELALANPEVNVLGLELRKRAIEWINNVIDSENIPNVRALWYSVVNGIGFIEPSSVEKIFYLFPDPWVKKRHHKRRAFNNFFLDEIVRVLKPDGKLYLMTDVEEVANYQFSKIAEHGGLLWEIVSDIEWGIDFKTNHEDFCLSKNIPYVRIICQKK